MYLVWTVLFLPIVLLKAFKNGELNTLYPLSFLQHLLFDGSYFHLWYLPSLIAAIVVVWLLKKIRSEKTVWIIAILLFVIGTAANTYVQLLPTLQPIVHAYNSVFLSTRNGLFFGTIFVLMGSQLAEKRYEGKIGIWLSVGIMAMVIEGIILNAVLHRIVVNMMASPLVLAPMVFVAALQMRALCKKEIGIIFRHMSTVVYCFHPVVIILIAKAIGRYSMIETLLAVGVSNAIAYVVSINEKRFRYLL